MVNFMVAIDDSGTAKVAFYTALYMMKEPQLDKLFLISVAPSHNISQEKQLHCKEVLQNFANICEARNLDYHCIFGLSSDPPLLVCNEASKRNIDFLIAGNRSSGRISRSKLILGSFSKFLSENAPCNVIVVKDEWTPEEQQIENDFLSSVPIKKLPTFYDERTMKGPEIIQQHFITPEGPFEQSQPQVSQVQPFQPMVPQQQQQFPEQMVPQQQFRQQYPEQMTPKQPDQMIPQQQQQMAPKQPDQMVPQQQQFRQQYPEQMIPKQPEQMVPQQQQQMVPKQPDQMIPQQQQMVPQQQQFRQPEQMAPKQPDQMIPPQQQQPFLQHPFQQGQVSAPPLESSKKAPTQRLGSKRTGSRDIPIMGEEEKPSTSEMRMNVRERVGEIEKHINSESRGIEQGEMHKFKTVPKHIEEIHKLEEEEKQRRIREEMNERKIPRFPQPPANPIQMLKKTKMKGDDSALNEISSTLRKHLDGLTLEMDKISKMRERGELTLEQEHAILRNISNALDTSSS